MENKELRVLLVEFAMAAHTLMNDGEFFDKDGYPQEGTVLLDKTIAEVITAAKKSRKEA